MDAYCIQYKSCQHRYSVDTRMYRPQSYLIRSLDERLSTETPISNDAELSFEGP